MAVKPTILDRFGQPLQHAVLTSEVAAPTFGGARSPISGYPADGLNPLRLGTILREADHGHPVRYLELAETIEERDLHYLGVLGTRKRSVSQLDITVEPASDAAADVDRADMVRKWLARDELAEEVFDILDAIGKGYSFTEIIWDFSERQYQPARLEYRDPRGFRFDRNNLASPMMLDDAGQEKPLPAFKFVFAAMRAKSGLIMRSGLARTAAWAYLFKKYTEKEWSIFTQTYGQPLRVGKYGSGASAADRDTLFKAVANIAGDCAAIIPESMKIDFVEASNVGAAHALYKERADWLDQQISKAVLGQTATTDAVTGGLGSGKEHRQVQEDIETADAKQLASIINRDLIRPWMMLEFGTAAAAPRVKIGRAEDEDLAAFSSAITPLVQVGLRVSAREIYAKFGLSEPKADEPVLMPPGATNSPPAATQDDPPQQAAQAALRTAEPIAPTHQKMLADRLSIEGRPAIGAMLAQIEIMLETADSLPELREMLLAGFPDIDNSQLADVMAQALIAANAGGRAAVEVDDG